VPKKKRLLLVQPTRHQPKTAFSRLPPLHRADPAQGPIWRVRQAVQDVCYLRIPAVHRINLKGQLWARQYALRERRLAGTRATHTARRCRCLRNGLVAGLWKPMSKAAKTA